MFSVPYSFYTDRYAGSMSEEEYYTYGRPAAVYVNYITLQRAQEQADSEAVQMAVCGAADALREYYTQTVQAESNDGISVQYAQKPRQDRAQAMYAAVQQYLTGTGLLYQGVYDDVL